MKYAPVKVRMIPPLRKNEHQAMVYHDVHLVRTYAGMVLTGDTEV